MEPSKEQVTNAQNEDTISDKPPEYDGSYVSTAPPYKQPTLPLPPYQEHLAPPPPYISEFDDVDLNGAEIQAHNTRTAAGYHRLDHRARRLFPGNLKFTLVVAAFCVSAIGVAIAMILVGGINITKCARVEVPVYLIVGGALLLAEIILRLTLYLAANCSSVNTNVINKARKMDFVLCLLFLWVCVGTVWVFRYSHSACVPVSSEAFNATTVSTTIPTTTAAPCMDCSDKVYIFAFGSMLLQYLLVLFLGVTFCRTILRRDT